MTSHLLADPVRLTQVWLDRHQGRGWGIRSVDLGDGPVSPARYLIRKACDVFCSAHEEGAYPQRTLSVDLSEEQTHSFAVACAHTYRYRGEAGYAPFEVALNVFVEAIDGNPAVVSLRAVTQKEVANALADSWLGHPSFRRGKPERRNPLARAWTSCLFYAWSRTSLAPS